MDTTPLTNCRQQTNICGYSPYDDMNIEFIMLTTGDETIELRAKKKINIKYKKLRPQTLLASNPFYLYQNLQFNSLHINSNLLE